MPIEPNSSDPTTWGLTRPEVKQLLQRAYNLYGEWYRDEDRPIHSWRDYANLDLDTLALEVENDSGLHDRYLRRLPDDVTAYDLLKAYRENRLPTTTPAPSRPSLPLPLREAPSSPPPAEAPWAPRAIVPQEPTSLKQMWAVAGQRPTKATAQAVETARTTIFLHANQDPQLDRVLGVRWVEITSRLRSWSGWSAGARKLHARFNSGLPESVQWHGLVNASFFGRKRVAPETLSSLVRRIEAPAASGWATPNGDQLRNYILRTFLAIDTRVTYKDLAFQVDASIKPNGTYEPRGRLITIRANSPHTVAHEIGHYLDDTWGRELAPHGSYLSREGSAIGSQSPLRRQWATSFRQFVHDLGDRADLRSDYTQDAAEVFARFVATFVDWTAQTAGHPLWDEGRYSGDRFHAGDYQRFVRLLQEKSLVDLREPPPGGVTASRHRRIAAEIGGVE